MGGLLRTRRTGPLESGSPPPRPLGDEGQGHEWVPLSCGSSPLRYRQHSFMLPRVWNVNTQHYIYAFSRHFIQSDLQCIQTIHIWSVSVFLGIELPTFCATNAMLYHWATGKPEEHAPETHKKDYVTLFSLKRSLHFLLSILYIFFFLLPFIMRNLSQNTIPTENFNERFLDI